MNKTYLFLFGIIFLLVGLLIYPRINNNQHQADTSSITIGDQPSNELNIKFDGDAITVFKLDSALIIGILVFIMVLLVFAFLRQKNKTLVEPVDYLARLTQKEKEIVHEIQSGKTNQEIADGLFISLSTVKTHINNIYKKLQIKSRNELLRLIPTQN